MNDEQDNSEIALLLVQKLFTDSKINADQRDALKDMIFEEDTILLSFFDRFNEPGEEDELNEEVIKYANGGNFGGKQLEDQNTTGESIEAMSSPVDSGIDMKKKRRMAALKKDKEIKAQKNAAGGFSGMSITQADIGASPQMQKGGIFKNKDQGAHNSPLAQADKWKLGNRNKANRR